MSLATLKKKTAHKYQNNSVSMGQFSINGTHRNQGYVGQTSLGRSDFRTSASGTESQGHGGCCGTYTNDTLKTSSISTTENSSIVKSSVLGARGILQKRTQLSRRPQPHSTTKPSDSINQSTSGDYVLYKRKTAIADIASCSSMFTIQFKTVGRIAAANGSDASTNVTFSVNRKVIAEITPKINDITVHTFHVYAEQSNFLTLLFEGTSGAAWRRTAIFELHINGVNVTDLFPVDRDNVGVDAFLNNDYDSDTTVEPNPEITAIKPSATNPFIVVKGDGSQNRLQSFPVSLFTIQKSIEGADCCERVVKTERTTGALSQGDYIFKRIAECASLDISYVEYNTNLGNPINTCS